MDHYSQLNLKKAATAPEHVVRKAEFDAALQAIGVEFMEEALYNAPDKTALAYHIGGDGARTGDTVAVDILN